MTAQSVTLAAGVPHSWEISGDYFHVSTSALNDLFVQFDDGKREPVAQGLGFRRYYDKVALVSATGGAVTAFVGFGSVADARATANVSVTTNVAPGNTFDDGGDVSVPDSSVTQLIAADADRLYALITLPSSAAGPIRVGTVAVGASSGTLLEPGMSVPIATTAALYAYHENGAAIDVVVASVREV